MYNSFYNFIIDEILVKYFQLADLSAGDKFYLLIEDRTVRELLYEAIAQSKHTKQKTFILNDEQGFDSLATPCEMMVIEDSLPVPILISDCDNHTDGFQTKIRNSVGVTKTAVEKYAVLFILTGSTTIETLLTTGQNLQAKSYPLHADEIIKLIESKIKGKINEFEQAYLKHFFDQVCKTDDFNTLMDFAPILSILQTNTIKGSFAEIGAFEDSEIYQSLFVAGRPQDRVQENTSAFSTIADIMGEMLAEDLERRLISYVGKRLAKKLLETEDNEWKHYNWSIIKKAIDDQKAAATLTTPKFILDKNSHNALIVKNTIGTAKNSKSYVIVCDPNNTVSSLHCKFNKDLRDVPTKNDSKKQGACLILSFSKSHIVKEHIGEERNKHQIIAIKVSTHNIFAEIENFFKLDSKGNIEIDLPDSTESINIGKGNNSVIYNGITPVELTENDSYRLLVNETSADKLEVQFKFGEKLIWFTFKIKSRKTPTLDAHDIIEELFTKTNNFSHNGIIGELKGTIESTTGPIYLQEYLRKFVNLEKLMVEKRSAYAIYSFDKISNTTILTFSEIQKQEEISYHLNAIYEYFERNRTVPSLHKTTDELLTLYKQYLKAFQNRIDNIPINQSLSLSSKLLGKIGTIQHPDGSLYFTPFHPLIVAYNVALTEEADKKEFNSKVLKELSPIHLVPYICYENKELMSISTTETENVLNWVKFIPVDSSNYIQSDNTITKLVTDKIKEFIKHFEYYFPDESCPVVLSSIGLSHSLDVIRGIIYYITGELKKEHSRIQKIELHEYVEDLLQETFFEKLNRNSIDDLMIDLLSQNNIYIEDALFNDTIRLLFTKLSYFKHDRKTCHDLSNYSHIVFYRLGRNATYSPVPTEDLRTETALNGLVSSISTNLHTKQQHSNFNILSDDEQNYVVASPSSSHKYLMGFGTNGLKDRQSILYKTAISINNLYAGLYNDGIIPYNTGACIAKAFTFDDGAFLNNVYNKSTWVTFVNPEVDIDFFYNQANVYVVHYVEQHSISAKLESITVTKHTKQYNNLVFNTIQSYKSITNTSSDFSRKIINYFNCLNGKWLLELLKKDSHIIREKISLVATCCLMEHFLKRAHDVIWIPIAHDEIIKATGAIGGKLDGLFSKKSLEIKGPLSDDLIMMGFKCSGESNITLYFYPVEVKVQTIDNSTHGKQQIVNLYNNALKKALYNDNTFTEKAYKVLFSSLFLTNAEKLKANGMISNETFSYINKYRYELLNLKFNICEDLPQEIGKAALVVYSDSSPKNIYTCYEENIPICHINMMESDCYSLVADASANTDILAFVTQRAIPILHEAPTVQCTTSTIRTEEADSDTNAVTEGQTTTFKTAVNAAEAAMFKFHSEGIKVELGINPTNNKKIYYEPNNTNKLTNPNMAIIGTMGTGKTQQALSIVAQLALQTKYNVGQTPIGILIFDYKGDDYSKDKFLNIVGGTAHRSNFPFNPLKLIRPKNDLVGNLPAITADNISGAFATVYSLGPIQKNNIYNVILETYKEAGITDDPNTWDKKPPTMNDVVRKYLETHTANDKAYALLQRFEHFTIFEQNSDNCVSMFEWLDRVRVIDLSGYGGDDTKKIIVSLILDLFYAEMKQLGESAHADGLRALRSMVLVDEAHHFLSKGFSSLRSIISEGRMFGVGIILSTQTLSDFKSASNDYSEYILSWLIHNVNKIGTPDVCNTLNVEKQEADKCLRYIRAAKKHESICKLGNTIVGLRDLPFYQLLEREGLDSTNIREEEIKTQ